MKIFILTISTFLMALSSWAVNGTFIQLNRSSAEKTVEEWQADFRQMAEAGIDTVMVQWSSEPPVMYFDYPIKTMRYMSETYPVLETIFEANRETGHQVYLGLQNNPLFWSQIQSRDKVLRDFLLIRISRNETLQLALLDTFDQEENWAGYYIPDEIDDLTWRHDAKRHLIKRYVGHMCERVRSNDSNRKIAMSAFFRGRTAPMILADNLADICGDSDLDYLLIQDGIGVGDPPIHYVPFYFKVLTERWANQKVDQTPILDFVAQVERSHEVPQAAEEIETDDAAKADVIIEDVDEADQLVPMHASVPEEAEETPAVQTPPVLPELWVVLEAFTQTSKEGEPFTAKPTSPDQLKKQLRNAQDYFVNTVFFTFQDYMDPDLGEEGAHLFQLMKKMNDSRASVK